MKTKEKTEEKSPFLGSWKNFYILVIVNLIVLISAFYAFKKYFS